MLLAEQHLVIAKLMQDRAARRGACRERWKSNGFGVARVLWRWKVTLALPAPNGPP